MSVAAQEKDALNIGHAEAAPHNLVAGGENELAVKVPATSDDWIGSGVVLRKGERYRITAQGEWHAGGACGRTGPSGMGAHNMLCWPSPVFPMIVPGYTMSTLVAKIGRGGKPFAVGDSLEVEAAEDGPLYLRINDLRSTWDNDGIVTAKVALLRSLAPPPVAAAAPPPSPLPALPSSAGATQYWAVVIGVSDYADSRIASLRYANADARALHDWLISPAGGRYAPARVRLLLDRDATARNIRETLFSWLRQAIEEDVVLIYFAGHGSPDSPETPQNLYLLPHDAQYDNIAATGFPMWDIETALKRFIKAKRVVVIADACHSGGVGAGFDLARRAMGDTANPVATGLLGLSGAGEGIAVISASDERQQSAEGTQFGGGHGVFTHFLLEGLKGRADYNGDGRITLGELIPYLSEQVRRATRNAQSPTIAGRFDPALAIAR